MKIFYLSILTLLLALNFGCSKSPSDMIVGKWQTVDSDQSIMEFFSDGTFSSEAKMGENKIDFNGDWSILDDGRLKIDFIMMGNTISTVVELSIKDESMTTTTDEGKTTESIRIQ